MRSKTVDKVTNDDLLLNIITMKRILATTALASTLFATPTSFVLAQVTASPSSSSPSAATTPGARRDARLTGTMERLERREERLDDRAASREAKLDARKQGIVDRIIASAKRMLERATRRVERLDAIWKRIVMRMDKIKANGKDLTSLDPLVADVSTKRQKALDTISTAQTTVDGLAGTNQPKTAIETFRTQFKSVIDALKGYQQSIVTLIRSLKGMGRAEGLTRSPTASQGATIVPSITTVPTSLPTGTP